VAALLELLAPQVQPTGVVVVAAAALRQHKTRLMGAHQAAQEVRALSSFNMTIPMPQRPQQQDRQLLQT
jgi:hypothetical protein